MRNIDDIRSKIQHFVFHKLVIVVKPMDIDNVGILMHHNELISIRTELDSFFIVFKRIGNIDLPDKLPSPNVINKDIGRSDITFAFTRKDNIFAIGRNSGLVNLSTLQEFDIVPLENIEIIVKNYVLA